jgi:hypothetical protein
VGEPAITCYPFPQNGIAMKQALVILVLSTSALACARGELVINTSSSFTVRITNRYGPVAGLQLRVTRFRDDEYLKATAMPPPKKLAERAVDRIDRLTSNNPQQNTAALQRRSVNIQDFVDVIGTAVTDSNGMAKFELKNVGRFMLDTQHPGASIDDVILNVSDNGPSAALEFKWLESVILLTKELRGQIADGLMSSKGAPLSGAEISLHELISLKQISSTRAAEDGSFAMRDVAPGFYFLLVRANNAGINDPDGYIPVMVVREAPRDSLSIAVTQTDCGLMYDLAENKQKYKPVACFKGGESVTCKY